MSAPSHPLPWSESARSGDSAERRRFVESHVDLVRYLALRLAARLPASVEVDDLVQDGVVGLLDAVEKFDPARGVRFRTYAESRVRGAILDGLRRRDWRPRSLRREMRELDEAVGRLSASAGGPAGEEEIAAEMGIDLDAYRALQRDLHAGPLLALDDLAAGTDEPAADPSEEPGGLFDRRELLAVVAEEVERIPERERLVLSLYYHEGLHMKEIGGVLGVTESRVCQLHAQAAARLRVAIAARMRAPAAPEESAVPARGGRR